MTITITLRKDGISQTFIVRTAAAMDRKIDSATRHGWEVVTVSF